MLLLAAGTTQALLLSELLLRRVLLLALPSRRNKLQRFADNSALSSFACCCLNTITIPLQTVVSIVSTIGRFWVLLVLACVFFGALMTLSSSSVYAYTVLARVYNIGVVPFGAWPFAIDVRLGVAAVSYSGSSAETDGSGDARTGLLGCLCIDGNGANGANEGFHLLCATAPYLQHIEDNEDQNDEGGGNRFKTDSTHTITFPDLMLSGMTCANTAVRVLSLRWPRKRISSTKPPASASYKRFSYLTDLKRHLGHLLTN